MKLSLRTFLIAACMLFGVQLSIAQSTTIRGIIADRQGDPLIGATILVKGTTTGSITDVDGTYSIEVESTPATLVFSYTGYSTQEVQVTAATTTLDVTMEESVGVLDEVIVVAYGTAKKGSFTGSATQINAEALEGRALTNVSAAIEGAAGIQFSPGDGQPGASSGIRVRGFGSVNASSEPLYVVDGIIFSGSLSSINPNDVESITVLKDASSTALYGSKAANGVVMITTKGGRKDAEKLTLNISRGVTGRGIAEYDRIGAEEYYPIMWEAYRNSLSISGPTPESEANQMASDNIFGLLGMNPFNVANDQIVGTDGQLNPNAQLLYPDDLDWQEPLVRAGDRTNVDLSYQGATEKTSYFASMSFLDDKGWILNSDFQRVTGRINVNMQPKDWIRTGFNLSGATSESNQAADGGSTSFVNPFFSSRRIAPIYPVYLHDPVTGEFILDDAGNRIFDLGDDRVGNTNGRHVIQETLLNVDRDRITTLGARAFIDLYFLDGFKFTANASLDKRFFNNEDFDNPIVGDGNPAGRAGRDASTRTTVSYNQLLNYTRDFGRHSITGLVGHESFEYEFNWLTGFRTDIVADGNTELVNFTNTSNLNSFTNRYTTEGYLARLEYDLDDKYYLSGSFRRDGSSRFDEEVRWGNFWSVGGAWRIDQESFLQGISWISMLKARASYGEVGNDSNLDNASLSFFASQALFSLGNNNANEPGSLVSTLAAPSLAWESNQQTDVALEFALFNYRVSGSIEFYNRITDDLIFNVPLPLSSGIDDVNQNIGAMYNRGFEIDLGVDIIRTDDFTWRYNINASTIQNQFTQLPQEEIIRGSKKLVVGGSIYDYWLWDWYGVDPTDGAALYILDDEVDPSASEVRTAADGTLVTTNQNKAKFDFVGTAVPDVFGSFNSGFTYKDFRLGVLFTYQIGGQTYDTNYAGLMSSGNYGNAAHTDILKRWQQPGDITDVPRLDVSQTAAFGAGSDRWLVSSSYIALRQINLSYDLPALTAKSIGMQSLRVYANGENVFFSTQRRGLYVNQNFNGTTQNVFTPSRVLTFGVTGTF